MKKNKYFIFIPSKGRADNCITAKMLEKDDLYFKIVIEPNEYDNYNKYYSSKKLLRLDKNNMGLAYSRQFIKEYSIKNNNKYHWQLDDDLIFYKRENNKNIKSSAIYNINYIEEYVNKYKNIGIAAMRNMVFAFSIKKEISINNQCSSSFLVNNKCKAKYRPDVIEDTDYSMQVLTENYCTLLFNRILFNNPANAKNSGGCTDGNYYSRVTELQNNLRKNWPGCFELRFNEKDGLTKVKPSRVWRTFKQRPLKHGEKEQVMELF